jgi:hypothetical protein
VNVGEVLDQFRSDAIDYVAPYLWSDTDALRYMNDAYGMFVRLTGGIADFTTVDTAVATGTLTVTGSSGSFTSVTVNGVDILGAGVAYTTSPTVTAAALAAQINLAAAASLNPFFTASSAGEVVTLTTNPGFGEMPNGWAVASTGTCSATYTPMAGGVNAITQVAIVAGNSVGVFDKRIMRIMKAYRATDQSEIDIKAQGDMTFSRDNDYGMVRPVYMDRTLGQVRYMIIGSERGKCRWVQVPLINDTAQLYVFRKSLVNIDPTAPDLAFEFDGVDEEHHTHLVLWMRRCAHLKQDAETFDKGKSAEFGQLFDDYCRLAKAEMDRERAKPRAVAYGGV